MKNLLVGIFAITILGSCGKFRGNATIVRDCTGTYLRMDNRDYLICNPSMAESYENGSSVTVKYQTDDECNLTGAACYMYHESHGNVKIISIE